MIRKIEINYNENALHNYLEYIYEFAYKTRKHKLYWIEFIPNILLLILIYTKTVVSPEAIYTIYFIFLAQIIYNLLHRKIYLDKLQKSKKLQKDCIDEYYKNYPMDNASYCIYDTHINLLMNNRIHSTIEYNNLKNIDILESGIVLIGRHTFIFDKSFISYEDYKFIENYINERFVKNK